MKKQFVCVKPKSKDAEEAFNYMMDRLHSCVVKSNESNTLTLSSISGRYEFTMNKETDKNWDIIK